MVSDTAVGADAIAENISARPSSVSILEVGELSGLLCCKQLTSESLSSAVRLPLYWAVG